MLKTKARFKLLLALGIMILAICVFNMNTVNATTDEEYVKSLKLTSNKYYEVDLDFLANVNSQETFEKAVNEFYNIIAKSYEKQINDTSVTVKASARAGGTMGINLQAGDGSIELQLFKNGVLCDTRTMPSEVTIPVIKVPSTVADNELNTYITNIITKYYKDFGEGITKIEKGTNSSWVGVDIPDGYTIYSSDDISCVIVRKEKATITEPVKVTTTDTTTNIKLETSEGVIPSNTILEVASITEGTTYNTVKTALTNISKFKVFDINLLSDGVKIQPNGKVKISIPVPTEYNKSNLVVYRVADNGDKTEYEVTVNGDVATFETDHFSTYVLAEKETTQNTENTNNTTDRKKDDTPKTGTISSIYFMIPVAVISATGIIAFRRKETK